MTPARTPAQKADACQTVEECDGFIENADAMLARPDTDHALWAEIRREGTRRRLELVKRGRKCPALFERNA